MTPVKSVEFEAVQEFVNSFGIPQEDIYKITILPAEIHIHTHRRNESGNKFVVGAESDPGPRVGDVIGEIATRMYTVAIGHRRGYKRGV